MKLSDVGDLFKNNGNWWWKGKSNTMGPVVIIVIAESWVHGVYYSVFSTF